MASAAAERYLASLPIEDQQAIRAGGDVDAWYNAAVAAGAVPQNFGGTAATTKPWWEMSAQEAGINPWQQDYKQEFATMTPQKLAQMSPEQRARWSMEHLDALDYRTRANAFDQWMAWQDSYDPSCPPSAPYRAEDGSGCVEKPDNSNAGYQQGQEGGAGGGGGRGKGQNGSQNLTSPLTQMLINQGSFLGGYDPTRGDNNPGVRGGVVGGGGIWWQPTRNAEGINMPTPPGPKDPNAPSRTFPGDSACPDGSMPRTVPCFNPPCPSQCADGSSPRGGEIKNTSPDPLGPYGGVMGGQGAPRGGAPTGSVIGGSVLNANQPVPPGGARGAPLPTGGGIVDPWGAQRGSRGTGQPPLGPYGGVMGGQSPLTNTMAGIQAQNKPLSPLGSMMTPYQKKIRTAGSWFGG